LSGDGSGVGICCGGGGHNIATRCSGVAFSCGGCSCKWFKAVT